MTRIGLAFLLAAMCASSTPVALAAQREGGMRRLQPPPPPPPPSPLSLSRPLGTDISSVRTNPPPGFDDAMPQSPFAARPFTYAPRVSRSRGPRPFGMPLGYGFGVPAYADTYPKDHAPAAVQPESVDSTLVLDVTPRTSLVFVDSAYVGTVDDLAMRGLTLSRGRHWLELEAPDYEKTLTEITITPGRPLRYRVDLVPVRRAALVVIPPRPPDTMYAIPGCYGGNRPPAVATLPPGCDIANVRVLRPPRLN